jgi:hypothetical protein
MKTENTLPGAADSTADPKDHAILIRLTIYKHPAIQNLPAVVKNRMFPENNMMGTQLFVQLLKLHLAAEGVKAQTVSGALEFNRAVFTIRLAPEQNPVAACEAACVCLDRAYLGDGFILALRDCANGALKIYHPLNASWEWPEAAELQKFSAEMDEAIAALGPAQTPRPQSKNQEPPAPK